MNSNHLRLIVLILVITIPFVTRQKSSTLKKLIVCYLLFALSGEIITLLYSGYNLLLYSIIVFFELSILTLIVRKDTGKSNLPFGILSAFTIAFIVAFFTNHSLIDIIQSNVASDSHIISLNQYFDLSTLSAIGHLVLVFFWLVNLIKSENLLNNHLYPRYLYILAFVILYGGTFFMLAIGRFLLPVFEEWDKLWTMIVHPTLLVFYITILIAQLWNKQLSS